MQYKNEIRIRNVKASTIERIDQLADEKGLSRSDYIKIILDSHVVYPEQRELQQQYETLVEKVLVILKNNTKALKKFEDINNGNI